MARVMGRTMTRVVPRASERVVQLVCLPSCGMRGDQPLQGAVLVGVVLLSLVLHGVGYLA
jgi:hypothetical protein